MYTTNVISLLTLRKYLTVRFGLKTLIQQLIGKNTVAGQNLHTTRNRRHFKGSSYPEYHTHTHTHTISWQWRRNWNSHPTAPTKPRTVLKKGSRMAKKVMRHTYTVRYHRRSVRPWAQEKEKKNSEVMTKEAGPPCDNTTTIIHMHYIYRISLAFLIKF